MAMVLTMTLPGMAQDKDSDAIKHLLMTTFDKPGAPLTVEQVTLYKDVAVAGWAQSEMGGRALLRKKDDKWVLTLCSGDALKEAKSLQHFGLNAEEADVMAKAVVDAETKLDPALVAKFATFDGAVMMNGEGHHPPVEVQGSEHKS